MPHDLDRLADIHFAKSDNHGRSDRKELGVEHAVARVAFGRELHKFRAPVPRIFDESDAPRGRELTRQPLHALTAELAAAGHVRFIENPRHRRSKLVQLTPKGDARYRVLNAQLLSIASTMVVALSEVDVRKTIEIVRHLSDDVKARSERL